MATVSNNRKHLPPQLLETVDEIMRIYKSLPKRPTIEEVEAAKSIIKTVATEEQMKIDEISTQEAPNPKDVPPELFYVFLGVKKTMVVFQNYEQKREASHIIEIDRMFQQFDDLIQRASSIVSGDGYRVDETIRVEKHVNWKNPVPEIVRKGGENKLDDEELKVGSVKGLVPNDSAKAQVFPGGTEKLNLLQLASLIEKFAKTGETVIELQGKLMDQVEWLPLSIGKLSSLVELDLSQNQIMALPPTLGSLKALTKLQLHGNQLMNLPSCFGELVNLTDLDLHANQLKSLPPSFSNLTGLISLDISSNHFTTLPDLVGNLISLQKLLVETNNLEELPYTIGCCISLVELRLNFNKLKALPDGVGKLERLQILTLHYNRLKGLPITMAGLVNLRELDISFNELECIPETLCFAVRLVKLNLSNNFADLTSLPRSIGNLEILEELDISDDQIKVLPESFRLLSNLKVFRADETPLEVPPRQITKLGAQAVVQYMSELVDNRTARSSLSSKKNEGLLFWILSMFCLVPCVSDRNV